MQAASKIWPSDVDSFVSWTKGDHILTDGSRNLLNYSVLSFLLLTLGKILLVRYISVCQYNVSVKVILCCGPAKQAFSFGVSCIKQRSPNPKCCSQALAVLPAMHCQTDIYPKQKVYSENTPKSSKKYRIMARDISLVILASMESRLKLFARNMKYLPRIPTRWL